MAKSETVKKDITSEEPAVAKTTLVEKPVPTPVVQDNRGFVLAVAGAVVLFIVGIILGYLWGNNTAGQNDYRNTMMSGQYRTFDCDDLRMYRQGQTTNQQQTSSSTSTNTTQQ